MIVKWPGATAPNTRCDTPVITDDILPTVLKMTQAKARGLRPASLDGRDLTPVLQRTGALPARPLLWHYPHVWGAAGPGIAPFSAVREGDWKLIYYHADRRFELFNLAEDIGETSDVSGQDRLRVRRMAATMSRLLKTRGAQMSVDRATGQAVPMPDEVIRPQER
jgi:arylsulfatase A-like enzyme